MVLVKLDVLQGSISDYFLLHFNFNITKVVLNSAIYLYADVKFIILMMDRMDRIIRYKIILKELPIV